MSCDEIRYVEGYLLAVEYDGLSEASAAVLGDSRGDKLITLCRDGELFETVVPANIDHSRVWLIVEDDQVVFAYRE